MKQVVVVVFVLVAFLACREKEHTGNLNQAIVGKWTATSMYVKLAPKKKGMPVEVMEVNTKNWEEKLSLKPTVHYFMQNGRYREEYVDLNDSMIFNPSGYWRIHEDTLILNQEMPESQRLEFAVFIKGRDGVLISIQDFNGDGVMDSLKSTIFKTKE